MIEFDNQSNLALNVELLELIASSLSQKDIELLVVDEDSMRAINYEHRGIDSSTDVLSFPLIDVPLLGSIVISAAHLEQKSQELKHSVDDEFALLFIHGLLHLLGYDHEVDNGEMRELEKSLIKKHNLPPSLIVRTLE